MEQSVIDTGNATISIADAEINCDVRSGHIHLTMSVAGSDSVNGILLKKIGCQGNIYVYPDRRQSVLLSDTHQNFDYLMIPGTKKRNVILKYTFDSKTWTILPDK